VSGRSAPSSRSIRAPRAAAAPAQDRAQPRQQLARLERLRQVVVGADLEPDHAVHRVAARGEHQHRGIGARTQPAADFQPVDVRQRQVEHQGVEGLACEALEPLVAGPGHGHAKARLAEIFRHHLGEAGVVLDQEDARAHARSLPIPAGASGGRAVGESAPQAACAAAG